MKAIKVRLYPTPEQADFLNQQFGAVRKVYNLGLAIMQNRYRYHHQSLKPKKDLKPLLVIAKRSRKYHWLGQYDSTALQQAVINLDKAFERFFKRQSGYPCFKNKHGRQSSFHCSGAIDYGDDWIKIGKLKTPIKARIHRNIEGRISSITISRDPTGKHYASLVLADNLAKVVAPLKAIANDKVLGVDVGLTHISIDSNGHKEENPRFLNNAMRNLRRKQKSLSRKTKGSQSRAKARLLVAKCHEKLANTRNDFQHKLSKTMVDENQAIIVETLKVKNMLKNRKLSRHISDISWGSLLNKLEYKAKEEGKHFKKVDQWYASSKMCCICHEKIEALPLSTRQWQCEHCGANHDRDINAAKNIRQQGLMMLKAEGLSVSVN